jgi:hypothetical protein
LILNRKIVEVVVMCIAGIKIRADILHRIAALALAKGALWIKL